MIPLLCDMGQFQEDSRPQRRTCTVHVPLLWLEAEEGTHLAISFLDLPGTGDADGAKNTTLAVRLALEK